MGKPGLLHLPTEILVAIIQILDLRDAVAMLQVRWIGPRTILLTNLGLLDMPHSLQYYQGHSGPPIQAGARVKRDGR